MLKFEQGKIIEFIYCQRNNGLLILLIILLIVVLRDSLAVIVDRIWVNPFMSKMYDGAMWYFLAISLLLFIYYRLSCQQERAISKCRIYAIVIISVIYLLSIIYSITNEQQGWLYKSLNGSKNILTYYTTLLLIIPVIGELFLYKKRHDLRKRPDTQCGLIYETPIERQDDDSYKRTEYATIVARKIRNNFHKEGSFVTSISGNWGSGKTSFLNLIKLELEQPKNDFKDTEIDIEFDFKPWLSSSANNIINDFFSQLSEKISLHIPSFTNQLAKYAEAISDIDIDPWLNNGLRILKRGLSESTGTQYDGIKSKLENAKLKTLVFVDDTDRLSSEEILELFRLVRNTANFPYLQFVITYDRDYLIKMLKVANPEKYMQKIFNMEITLPTFNPKVIRESLWEEVDSRIEVNQSYKNIIKDFLYGFEDEFPIDRLIRTRRDVIRFINAFILTIGAFSKYLQDTNLLDLFKLELVRYKYPDYYDKLSQDPLSELVIHNDTYRLKKQQPKGNAQSVLNENDLKKGTFPEHKFVQERGYRYINQEDVISVCMNNLFPQTPVMNNNSVSKIRAYDLYFRYKYDENNITVSEIIQLLEEKDGTQQLQKIDEYYLGKKKREVFHMVEFIISQWGSIPWKEEEKSPFYYKTTLSLLSKVMDSKNLELKKEVISACSPIFSQTIYGNLDYYLDILKLWDRTVQYDVLDNKNIVLGFMVKNNLQAKINQEITEDVVQKIANFLRECESLVQMSSLLSYYTDPDNNQSWVLDKRLLKDIQRSYFMKYAEKEKVDEDCISLFVYSADIEPTSRIFLWNNKASVQLRKLVDIDPQGYLSVFITKDETFIHPPRYWKPIFQENPKEVEKYLFAGDKEELTGIEEARTFWNLYKNNGYKEILINPPRWKNLDKNALIIRLGNLLDKTLEIKDEVGLITIETNEPIESQNNKASKLQALMDKLNAIPLDIELRNNLIDNIEKRINSIPIIKKMRDKLGLGG